MPGRDSKNIYFAVDFLSSVTKSLLDQDLKEGTFIPAKGKHVLVIGGGDTGNDCVGTAIRLGAKSVTQLEMMPKPSKERTKSNPWPQWPRTEKTDYGQEEAIAVFGKDPRMYQTTVKEFQKDKNGNVKKAVLVSLETQKDKKTGRMQMVPVPGSEKSGGCQSGTDRRRVYGQPEICNRCIWGICRCKNKCSDKRRKRMRPMFRGYLQQGMCAEVSRWSYGRSRKENRLQKQSIIL